MLSNRNNISLSLCINKVLFSNNYMEMLKEFDEKFTKLFFVNLSLNVINDHYVTRFGSDINARIYDILNYYRDLYKKASDFEKISELINDSIAVLNNLDYKDTLYSNQFHERFKTIYNYFLRKLYIKKYYDEVKDTVISSICNDLVVFQNLRKLDENGFIKSHQGDLITISSIVFLINNFPEILGEEDITNKLIQLLNKNIELSYDKIEDGDIIFSSSVLTRQKIYKKINK